MLMCVRDLPQPVASGAQRLCSCTPVEPLYLLFAAFAIPQLSSLVWRRRGRCNVSQQCWDHLGVSMTPVLYPLQSPSPSQKRGVDWELWDGWDEKIHITNRLQVRAECIF